MEIKARRYVFSVSSNSPENDLQKLKEIVPLCWAAHSFSVSGIGLISFSIDRPMPMSIEDHDGLMDLLKKSGFRIFSTHVIPASL